MLESASIVIGYLLGSIPAAYYITRLRKGIDIREVDVRNMGSASVFRVVGIWEGIVTAIIDIGKGAAAVYIAQVIGVSQYWAWGAGFAAIIGHSYPVFIGFRGGRSVATFIGVMLVISPVSMGISLGIIGLTWLIVRHLFTTIAITAPLFIIVTWLVEKSPLLLLYILVVIIFILFRTKYRLGEIKIALSRLTNKRNLTCGNTKKNNIGASSES